jgi:hypothetical protein
MDGLAAASGLLLALASATAPAADWVMLQGTEPADAAPYRFFGAAWLTYANNFGCDAFAGLRRPDGTPSGSATGGPALNNGKYHNACVVGPEFKDTEELVLENLMGGVRGNLIPGRINYYLALNAGANFFNYLPYQTERHVLLSVQDASLTFSYIPGARVRAGLFKKPGPEDIQRAPAPEHIFPFAALPQWQGETFVRSNAYFRDGVPIPGQGYAGGVASYGYDADLGRDWGVQAFDSFRLERWNLGYALMWGWCNGIHLRESLNPTQDLNAQLTAEYDLPGGKGPNKHGVKLTAYYQQGERKFLVDVLGTESQAFDRIRYGLGLRALGELFGEGNGSHRIGLNAMYGEGMIFFTPSGNVVEGAFGNGNLSVAAEKGNKARGYSAEYGYYLGDKWQFGVRWGRNNTLYAAEGLRWTTADERKLDELTLNATWLVMPNLQLGAEYQFRDMWAPNPVLPPASTAAAINNAAVQTTNQNIVTGSVGDRFALRLIYGF